MGCTVVLAQENLHSDLVKHWQPLQNYLNQYGYLTTTPEGADNLRTEEKLRDAIRRMQRFGGIPMTGVVDSPTLELLQRKRCGMPDLSPAERVRRYAIQGQSWQKKNLTWKIKQYPPGLYSGRVRQELSKAFYVWSEVSQLNFEEVSSHEADIIVSFERGQHGDGYAFDGRGIVLAHAFFPGEGIGGDAHFDAEEPWVDDHPVPGVDGVRLFAVAAHEFGHSLGLSHSSVTGALMNPFYQTVKENFELPHDDTIGIQMIYGARNPTRFAPLSPYIPQTTRRPVVSTTRTRRPSTGRGTARPQSPRPTKPSIHHDHKRPSTCNTTFDAISVIRRQLFIFKGKYFWRFENQGPPRNDYPVQLNRLWDDDELQHVDAVYERPIDTKIVFFSGAQYWLFDGVKKVPSYPRPLTDLGLPPDLKRIDAAMVWGYNGKTYFFAGTQYWRYDELEGRVELDYPRDMGLWQGVPTDIDAAFQFTDGNTYFFKGRKFWQFQDKTMKVKKNKFNDINHYWFGCPSHHEQAPDIEENENDPDDVNSLSKCTHAVPDLFLILSFVTVFLIHRTKYILYL